MNIGVIGGANGPTAIFIASSIDWVFAAIIGVVIVAGIVLAIVLKKKKRTKKQNIPHCFNFRRPNAK